jgi:hypothetical protein
VNNSNSYKWYKHPDKKDNLTIDEPYLENIKKSWSNFRVIEEDRENNVL